VFAPQSGDAHALVQKDVAGHAAGPAGVSGLLDLKVCADAGMAHGWCHAHGVILFESMRRLPDGIVTLLHYLEV